MKTFFLVVCILISSLCIQAQTPIVLGNPSGAVTDVSQPDNYLVYHNGYILSYSHSRNAPNWVTWHLSGPDIGSVNRTNAFGADNKLPADWRVNGDTFGSTYDRGHMCPSEDRTDTNANNRETFLMSNMAAQVGKLNRGTWKSLESYVQSLAKHGSEAYLYAGCYGNKGVVNGKIMIPTHCWKVVVILPEGNNDRRRINCNTRVIAVDMPNEPTIVSGWRNYRTTISALETATGFQFLSTLSATNQTCLKSKTDNR